MELNKFYKVIYTDGDYNKVARGKLLSEDNVLFCLEDVKEGKIWIGKNVVVSIKELGEQNDRNL